MRTLIRTPLSDTTELQVFLDQQKTNPKKQSTSNAEEIKDSVQSLDTQKITPNETMKDYKGAEKISLKAAHVTTSYLDHGKTLLTNLMDIIEVFIKPEVNSVQPTVPLEFKLSPRQIKDCLMACFNTVEVNAYTTLLQPNEVMARITKASIPWIELDNDDKALLHRLNKFRGKEKENINIREYLYYDYVINLIKSIPHLYGPIPFLGHSSLQALDSISSIQEIEPNDPKHTDIDIPVADYSTPRFLQTSISSLNINGFVYLFENNRELRKLAVLPPLAFYETQITAPAKFSSFENTYLLQLCDLIYSFLDLAFATPEINKYAKFTEAELDKYISLLGVRLTNIFKENSSAVDNLLAIFEAAKKIVADIKFHVLAIQPLAADVVSSASSTLQPDPAADSNIFKITLLKTASVLASASDSSEFKSHEPAHVMTPTVTAETVKDFVTLMYPKEVAAKEQEIEKERKVRFIEKNQKLKAEFDSLMLPLMIETLKVLKQEIAVFEFPYFEHCVSTILVPTKKSVPYCFYRIYDEINTFLQTHAQEQKIESNFKGLEKLLNLLKNILYDGIKPKTKAKFDELQNSFTKLLEKIKFLKEEVDVRANNETPKFSNNWLKAELMKIKKEFFDAKLKLFVKAIELTSFTMGGPFGGRALPGSKKRVPTHMFNVVNEINDFNSQPESIESKYDGASREKLFAEINEQCASQNSSSFFGKRDKSTEDRYKASSEYFKALDNKLKEIDKCINENTGPSL